MFVLLHKDGRPVRYNIGKIEKYLEFNDGTTRVYIDGNQMLIVDERVEELDELFNTLNKKGK